MRWGRIKEEKWEGGRKAGREGGMEGGAGRAFQSLLELGDHDRGRFSTHDRSSGLLQLLLRFLLEGGGEGRKGRGGGGYMLSVFLFT